MNRVQVIFAGAAIGVAMMPAAWCAGSAGTAPAATTPAPASSSASSATRPKVLIGVPQVAPSNPAAPVKASGHSCMCTYQDGLCLAGAGAWTPRLQDKIVARTIAGEPLVRVDAFAAACADRDLSEIRVRSITYVDQQGPKAIIEWETIASPKASAATKAQSEERKPVIINSRP